MIQKNIDVIGYFQSQKELSRCVAELRETNLISSKISTFTANHESVRPVNAFGHIHKNVGVETGVAGACIGAALGSMLGFLFGSGYLDFFNHGSSSSISPYFSVAVGSAVGAVFGGAGGAYVGHKIPEERPQEFEHQLSSGEIRILVSAENESQSQLVKFILAEFGATHISSKHSESAPLLIYPEKLKNNKMGKYQQGVNHHR